jgi:N utilization substance protein B
MNRSLLEKKAARLAAVQCLYQAKMRGFEMQPATLIDMFGKQLEMNAEDKEIRYPAAPDMKLFSKIITGVCEHYAEINGIIEARLKEGWKKERMNTLTLALLEAALCELLFLKSLRPAMVINEYVTMSRGFFTEQESGFINAALDSAATLQQ